MTTKAFRSAVFGAIQTWQAANFPTLPVIYENGPVPDEDKIGPVWLDLELRWYGAVQLGLNDPHSGRHTGAISANVFYRIAQGTATVDDIIDSLSANFSNQRLGGALLRYPQRTVPTTFNGWHKSGILIPFTLDV